MAPSDTGQIAAQGVPDTIGADTLPADTAQAMFEPPPPEPEGPETIFDRPMTKRQQAQDVLRAYANPVYRPVRRGEFYSAGFLTEQERIPWAKVVGNTAKPSIQVLADPTVAGRFEEIAIVPPAQASYHVGDSLLVARIDRTVDPWGDAVVPVGVARVTAVQPQQVLALVIMQFGRIKGGNLAMPLEPFKDPGVVRPTAVEQGLDGRMIGLRDEHVLAGSQQVVFIDKGRADGGAGNVFEVHRAASEESAAARRGSRPTDRGAHPRAHGVGARHRRGESSIPTGRRCG
jgi:hypothetical protein